MRKLVRDMTPEEHGAYKKDLQAKKDLIRSMSPEERAAYEKARQRKWSDAYLTKAYDTVNFRTPKGGKEVIKQAAAEQGMTLNDFLRKMIFIGIRNAGIDVPAEVIYPAAVVPEGNR